MKIERSRACRKGARRYHVSPVARAVRNVLTVSAAALMFSGTGLVLAKSPTVPPVAVERATLSHEFAPVVDLTRVPGEGLPPRSVVEEGFETFAGFGETDMASIASVYAPEAELAAVQDLTTLLPGTFHSGPGGVSGSNNVVIASFDVTGSPTNTVSGTGTFTATTNDGFADGVFMNASSDTTITSNVGGLDITGSTWAAGFEVEVFGDVSFVNNTTIDALATGASGIAFGLYVNGEDGASIHNNATMTATATGYAADAMGMYAFSYLGDAAADNFGAITASATGNATGSKAASIYGDASVFNAGTLAATGYYATGMEAYSFYGDAVAGNAATLTADGAIAQGVWAHSVLGDATASNLLPGGNVTVNGTLGAVGVVAGAQYGGHADALNQGTVTATSTNGVARGVWAYGNTAEATNEGTVDVTGDVQAIGLQADGLNGAVAVNGADLVVNAGGDAFGVWSYSANGAALSRNDDTVGAHALNGTAYGLYSYGYVATSRNEGTVDATSQYGDAIAALAGGFDATVLNNGTLSATGSGLAAGMFGLGAYVSLVNGNAVYATATATDGFAVGAIAMGGDLGVHNGGGIVASGAYATGIDARAAGNATLANDGSVSASGGDVTGIVGTSSGGGVVGIDNFGGVDADGDNFAAGLVAVSRGYLGEAHVYNGGGVYATSKYGSVQGIVASADMHATVDNVGSIQAFGGSSAYGVLALSADGDTIVHNGGDIIAVAGARGGVAYGVAVQTNNGLASVTNDNVLYAIGETAAIGVYAATKWNDAEITNNGLLMAGAKYGAATGAIAVSYTGDANATNNYGAMLGAVGGTTAVGLRGVSIYGDAHVVNDGIVQTQGNTRDRGLMASALYGGDSYIVNTGEVHTDSDQSFGAASRAYYGHANVDNSGLIQSTSDYGIAYAVLAGSLYGSGASVINSGDLVAYAGGIAVGVMAYGDSGDVDVANTGTILAGAGYAAFGVQALAYGTATVVNDRSIEASAYLAGGIVASGDVVDVTNNDAITVDGYVQAIGIDASGGTIDLDNTPTGTITTSTYAGAAIGMAADATGTATVRNGGGIDAYSYVGSATGILALSDSRVVAVNANGGTIVANSVYGGADGMVGAGDRVDITNAGTIEVNGYHWAAGIESIGDSQANVVNNGDISATSHLSADYAAAFGVYAYALGDAHAANNGTIAVGANDGRAVGMYAVAYGASDLANCDCASIDVSTGGGLAGGMLGYGDAVTIDNGGLVNVHGGDFSVGLGAQGMYDASTVSIYNSGTMYVGARGKYGTAIGILASSGGDVDVDNAGAIHAADGQHVYGIVAESGAGTITVANGGDIFASSSMPFGQDATGIQALSDYGDIVVDNTGSITVASKYAMGVMAMSGAGDVGVSNGGDIDVEGFSTVGLGILAQTDTGDATVTNDGTLTVHSVPAYVLGAVAISNAGLASVTNTGTISATSEYNGAGGIYVGGHAVQATNGGDIVVTGAGSAAGIGFDAVAGADIVSTGSITVVQTGEANPVPLGITLEDGNAYGIFGYVEAGLATVTNAGTIDVSAYDNAIGILALGGDAGSVMVDGDGTILAHAHNGMATGIVASTRMGEAATTASVHVDGTMTVQSDAGNAVGIFGYGNAVDVQHGGAMTVGAYAAADGINVLADDVLVGNGGTIDVSTTSLTDDVNGVWAYGLQTVSIDNAGDITVLAHDGEATGINASSYLGDVSVASSGTIHATSAHAIGVLAVSDGHAGIANGGDIAVDGTVSALGMGAFGGDASIANDGSVVATATGDDAFAYGAFVGATTASLLNSHALHASADGVAGMAIGALLVSDAATVGNTGSITASATGLDGQAVGVAIYGSGAFASSGDVYAVATQGAAIGARIATDGEVSIDNDGTISAHAAGETIGLLVEGTGSAHVANGGTIGAIHADSAVALGLYAEGTTVVENTGTIVAHATEAGSLAIAGGDAVQDIRSAGDIDGAFDLGGGDDLFANQAGGTWIVRGHGTDFGDGDDGIANAGTIVLHDASISLGGNGAAGNTFANTGVVSVLGDSFIDMGTGAAMTAAAMLPAGAPIDVLNPNAFTNDGTISFLDGAPDDTLTIAGDLAGDGALNVDVSLLHGTSDMLYVEGNILGSAVQSLNVAVLDMFASSEGIDIPVVMATGQSAEGNVAMGSVVAGANNWSANNFINLQVGVTAHLDAENAGVDMFSLTLVPGSVNDTGAAAASIAPGAHSLMAAQVGTFRQRMGVFTQLGDSDKGAWVRVFGEKGTVAPEVRMDNLPQSDNFAFDQDNTGIEAGFNALVTDGVYVGASLGTSKGKQDLVNGLAQDDIDGTTVGGYLTWLGANGAYADLSYRWMNFDAELRSAGGRLQSGGDAGAFNVEAGWTAWTSEGGLRLVPQLQYTRTTVSNIDPVAGDLADFVTEGSTSSRGRAGLAFQQTFKSASGATWTPYGVLSIVREFEGESRFAIADVFTGTSSTEGTSGMLELGVNAKVGAVDVWGGLNWTDGGALDSVLGGQIGVRYTW